MHSQTENKELMAQARASLKGHWGIAIGGFLIYALIFVGLQFIPILGPIIEVFITGAMLIGINTLILAISRNENAQIAQLFEGFNTFKTALAAYLLQSLFIFLWMLLLIIPGIIAAYSYAMTFYILADDKTIGARDAIAKSKQMMAGNKAKLFFLSFRFFGWILLGMLTLGIGFIWIVPYINVSIAKFYDDLKKNQLAQEAALV